MGRSEDADPRAPRPELEIQGGAREGPRKESLMNGQRTKSEPRLRSREEHGPRRKGQPAVSKAGDRSREGETELPLTLATWRTDFRLGDFGGRRQAGC